MIDAQLQQAEKELNAIEIKNQEIAALRESLGELKNVKKGAKSLSPMGFGIYSQGKIDNTKELLVNVGAGVIVKKPLEEVRKVLESQESQFKLISANLMQNIQMMAMQAQAIENQLK